jgi:alkaline phosphatase
MLVRKAIFILTLLCIVLSVSAQENYKEVSTGKDVYSGLEAYRVKSFPQNFRKKKPRNVILMIGDGMGVAQVFAGLTANHGHLFLDNFKSVGFSKTQSSDRYVTDSAAGGTALSTGQKTYNGAVGVNADTVAIKSILEMAEDKGLATGLVSTSAITHATPASFIAHQKDRTMYEEIAADFLKTDIDVFIGGGYKHFTERKDERDLANELKAKGYNVLTDMNEISRVTTGKLAGLTAPEHNGKAEERGDMLQVATQTALNILGKNKEGFFLMVEGSQIDWGCHQNNTLFLINEVLDFDKAIGKALEFAALNGETLIIVTADHETGGLSLVDGDMKTGKAQGAFTTGEHTGVMVPVFSYGPGADRFTGIMGNTDIPNKIRELLGIE